MELIIMFDRCTLLCFYDCEAQSTLAISRRIRRL